MSVYLTNPGPNHDYDFSGPANTQDLTNRQVQATNVSSSINPLYATKWTPMQKTKALVITLVALAAIALTVVLFKVSFASPIIFVAIPLAFAVTFGIVYLATRPADLDSPKVREEHLNKIANMAFRELAETYSKAQVVGYDLLRGKIGPISHEDPIIYAYTSELINAKGRVDRARDNAHGQAVRTYTIGIDPARTELERRRENAQWRSLGTNVAISALQSTRRHPSVGLEVARGVYNVGEHINHANNVAEFQSVTVQWRAWLQNERSCIEAAYQNAMTTLEQRYQNAFINPQAIVVN